MSKKTENKKLQKKQQKTKKKTKKKQKQKQKQKKLTSILLGVYRSHTQQTLGISSETFTPSPPVIRKHGDKKFNTQKA